MQIERKCTSVQKPTLPEESKTIYEETSNVTSETLASEPSESAKVTEEKPGALVVVLAVAVVVVLVVGVVVAEEKSEPDATSKEVGV